MADQSAIEEELARLAKTGKPAAPRQPRIRAGRQPRPPHLPRIVHVHEPEGCRPCATIVADGLLVWVLIGKVLDHLPLYRLAQIAARQNVPLALSTLADWVGRLGVALQPLADRLAALQRLRPVLHADETPVQQLDPGRGKTKQAYLWAYRSNGLDGEPPILLFEGFEVQRYRNVR